MAEPAERPHLGRALAGIRVLDFSRLLAGPWCSLLLADLGAEVIKVETPLAGDYARMAPAELGFGGVFEAVNRGKRSIAVNYRLPRGREIVLRLAATADVVLESSMPGQLARRGLGATAVQAVNPRIVYCSLSGYGQDGPYRNRPGHDLDYLAIGGLLTLLGPIGARPVPPGLQVADMAGGTMAALEILAALFRRERTGEGAVLDVAMLDAVVAWLGTLGAGAATAGVVAGPLAGTFPCYAVYPAADGAYLALGALEPQFWVAFCRAVGREDLVPRQFDPTATPEVAEILESRPRSAWLADLGEDSCIAPVNTPAEAQRDPHVRARGLVAGAGSAVHFVSPLRAAAGDGGNGATGPAGAHAGTGTNANGAADGDRPAPGLGSDTLGVLADAGYADAEIRALLDAGVIGGPPTAEATARAVRLGSVLARLAERHSVSSNPRPGPTE
ncbi:MAG TPA: CaiB/BaiF CoA-transferase family protein [Patescibacteria group bacterium]|nr:CaiB/BaiF CoA-transferase family protein [Patescibacteria group bacterium]